MVYGEEEIFTSSFQGFFKMLMKKMGEEKISGYQLLDIKDRKFRIFIKLLAKFNKLNEFLETMNYLQGNFILPHFLHQHFE